MVNDDILANTNLRVALRVQSKEDSANVIGVPDASAIERTQMGRAYVKLGQEDISAAQTALVTGQAPLEGATQLELRKSSIFGVPLKPLTDRPTIVSDENDLDLLEVIGQLPASISVSELGAHADLMHEPWRIPVGLGEQDLRPVFLEVYQGEHILIAGAARSGKSTLLLSIKALFDQASVPAGQAAPEIWAICTRRSPLASAGINRVAVGEDDIPTLTAQLRMATGINILLIDDADGFADGDKSLGSLIDSPPPGLCVIAAGRADELRTLYNHWTKSLRKAKCGVLLQPNVDMDGDLLGAKIPRKSPVELTQGRGYAVSNGTVHLIQAVQPSA